MPVRLHAYEGEPPEDALLRSEFLRDAAYTYVVATSAQERQRQALAPPHQRAAGTSDHRPAGKLAAERRPAYEGRGEVFLAFPKMVRHLMAEPCLTRSEQRVLVRRAILDVAGTPEERTRLLHDLGPLSDALEELEARGIDLADGHPPPDGEFASPQLLQLLADLQHALRPHLARSGLPTFEQAARRWLVGVPPFGDLLVLEGFTFLTPLQRLMVERFSASGRAVIAIFPMRPEQPEAFRVMEDTYRRWWPPAPTSLTEGVQASTALSEVQERLFAGGQQCFSSDASLRVRGFDHEHEEVRACIEEVGRVRLGVRFGGRRARCHRHPFPAAVRRAPAGGGGGRRYPDPAGHPPTAASPHTCGSLHPEPLRDLVS